MSKLKVLFRNETFSSNKGTIVEIIEFNGGKFKIISDIHNGGEHIKVFKMDSNGIFQLTLSGPDLPSHSNELSYVSDENRKSKHLEDTLNKVKDVIVKVYS